MKSAAVLAAAAFLAGCELVGFYRNETAGISPVELVPLYFQEKQYVTDRNLEAKVRGTLAARGFHDVAIDVYLQEVTLRGDPRAAAIARSVHGVESVQVK